jgi:hypothetical protein
MQALDLFLFADFTALEVPKPLRKRIAESFLYVSKTRYFELESFLSIMHTILIAGEDPQTHGDLVLGFIFDMFTQFSGDTMSLRILQEVINQFFPSTDEDGLKKNVKNIGKLCKTEFIAKMQEMDVKLATFELLSTIKTVEFGIKPNRPS